MMDTRCTTDKYDQLYARYLENPGTLLDLCGWEPGMRLLDLCGGTGAVSLEALRRGADPDDILLLDLNPRCRDKRIRQAACDVNYLEGCLGLESWGSFDRIVCRQAMAYISMPPRMAVELRRLLRPGGKLAFNIFHWPAYRSRWVTKRYEYDGATYYEYALRLGRKVYHLQFSPLIGADVSVFFQHREGELHRALDDGHLFDCHVHREGRSQRWVCTRLEMSCNES